METNIINTIGVTKSWVGKPKRMLDIAYKYVQGLLGIDISYCVEDFSKTDMKNALKVVAMKTSLQDLLAKCVDFIDEETLLKSTVK